MRCSERLWSPELGAFRSGYAFSMNRVVFNLYVIVVLLLAMLLGLFGAYGSCVPFWGSHVFDTAFGSPPDRSHPAFWVALLLLFPAMLLGAAGAVALLILPVAFRFPEAARIGRLQSYQLRFLRWYAERILAFVSTHDTGANDKTRNA